MISIQEAASLVVKHRMDLSVEMLPLPAAGGRVLAEAVSAPFDSPRFDNSAMDGIAVKWEDVKAVKTEKSVTLKLAGESSAGQPWQGILKSGEALRINTGAVVPDGADTVIPQEQCTFNGTTVTVNQIKENGNHVRLRGEEYSKGGLLYPRGTVLNPAIVGVLASIGMKIVPVYKAPRITLVVTGTELVNFEISDELDTGQIFDSNRPMLLYYLQQIGLTDINVVRVEDNRASVNQIIEEAKNVSDIIISTGGVSVGPHDHIPSAVGKAGFRTVIEKVAQKPGKPLFFAVFGANEKLYFGLPGNPVSAFMTFTRYVYPELCRYLGKSGELRRRKCVLEKTLTNPGNRTAFIWTKGTFSRENRTAAPIAKQGSHLLYALSQANGFIVLLPETTLEKGSETEFCFFPWETES